MTSKQRVKQAISFQRPDRTPIWMFNRDQEQGDILRYKLALVDPDGLSEWGYRWINLDDGTMGQPELPVIPSWDDLEGYKFPALKREKRLAGFAEFDSRSKGYYRLAGMRVTGFTTYTFLRGFENAMLDFVSEPERAGRLLDRIMSFEKDIMSLAAEIGLDGFHLADDWGTQEGLIISPDLWRRIFKPRYHAQFEHAHRLGLDVWFHCCGNILEIVTDLNEVGVDVLNISQPNVVDMVRVGEALRGKQCFLTPISYQTISINGTPDEIHQEARRLHDLLATPEGGFIGYVEEYGCVGMTEENYQACVNAFRSL